MFIDLNTKETDLTAFCKFKINKKDYLIGMPLVLKYAESITDDPISIHCFYGIDAKESYDVSAMYLRVINEKDYSQEEINNIQEAFRIAQANVNEMIRKEQPDFFDKINRFCYELHSTQIEDINKHIIKALTNKHEQPLLLAGLSGYGKTASFEYLMKNIKTKTISELQTIYNIDEEKAKKIKNFTSTGFVEINEESKKAKLMGNYSLEESDKGVVTILENGALGSLIKDCYYANKQTLVVFDEILDSPEVMKSMKSALMPKNDNYHFTPPSSREFLLVDGSISVNDKKTNLAFFEVAQKSDNMYSCDDNALQITKNSIVFNDKLTISEKFMLNNSIAIGDYQNKDEATVKRFFLNSQMANLDLGVKILLISKDKAQEIKANLDCKEIKKNKDFVVNKEFFKVCATGNVMHNIDTPTRERFNVVSVGGIDYNQLKNNLLIHRYGINSKLVDKLDSVSPKAYEKLIDSIILFAKNITDLQNQDVLPKADFGYKQIPYSQNELSSPSFNPRLITNIINQSENLNDITDKFYRSAERILEIFGLPNEEEKNFINRYNDSVELILEKELSDIAKEFKLEYFVEKTKEEKFIDLISKIDELQITKNKTQIPSLKMKM